jgi:small-conductance mechanosensitive channel
VIGVALGLGAQTIVRDVLSGIFMLVEDQYGVGDEINVLDVEGVVENVGLRITTVRDKKGTLWYLRNGEILKVGNKSKKKR